MARIAPTGSRSVELKKAWSPFAADPGFFWSAGDKTKLAVKTRLRFTLHRQSGCGGSLLAVRCAGQAASTNTSAHLNALQWIVQYLRIKNGTAMAKPTHR